MQSPAVRAAPEPASREAHPDVPTISLGGKDWPIPLLAPRQNRIVQPHILPYVMKMYPKFKQVQEMKARMADGAPPPADFSMATEAEFDTLVDVVTAALTRAHPDFRRDDLLDMPGVGAVELILALPVIMKQCGLFVKAGTPGAAEAPKPGERASPGIGTGSSPGPAGTSEETQTTGKTG